MEQGQHGDPEKVEGVPLIPPVLELGARSTTDGGGVPGHSHNFGSSKRNSFRGGRRLLRPFLKQKLLLILIVATTIFVFVAFQKLGSPKSFKLQKKIGGENRSYPRKTTKCHFPKLDPFSPQIMSQIDKNLFRSNPNCHGDNSNVIFKDVAFHVENGDILVRDVDIPGNVTCCFRTVNKHEDEEVSMDENCQKIETSKPWTAIQMPTELILVSCNNSNNESYYKDAFQLFQVKPEVESRIKQWEDAHKNEVEVDQRLSVIVFGIDSTSQLHFQRSMPESKKYLEEMLNAVKISGYNKVGKHTYPNMMPLFAGMTANELTKFCVRKLNGSGEYRVDNKKCPFIWNAFASNGYRTSYAEDDVGVVLFNFYFRNAFADAPPADYYNRPYSILFERKLGFEGKYCYGPRLQFEALLENVRAMADTFREKERRPYFNVVWATKLTHNDMNRTPWGDKPLLKLLQYLRDQGHMNHTALFLLGDHGIHWNQGNEQVMLENRMPLAYIVLPSWFPQRYSRAFQNLRWNAENELASHFDMYRTILDIMDLERMDNDLESGAWRGNRYFDPKNETKIKRGQSLFEISVEPHGRNCESAGVPYIWCVCPRRVPLKNDSALSILAADAVVSGVNRTIHPACGKLRLGYVYRATVMVYEHVWRKPECRRIILENTNVEEDLLLPLTQLAPIPDTGTKFCSDRFAINVKILSIGSDSQVLNSMAVREASGKISFLNEDQQFPEGLDPKNQCANFYLYEFPL